MIARAEVRICSFEDTGGRQDQRHEVDEPALTDGDEGERLAAPTGGALP